MLDQLSIATEPRMPSSALNTEELNTALKELSNWKIVESDSSPAPSTAQHELQTSFNFRSFKQAMAFVQSLVPLIERLNHHPRWENQWKTVTIHLTTWDAGHCVSKLDIQMAREINEIHARFAQ